MKNMIKSLILTVAISVIGISAYAVPACPNSFTVDQPNGTELTLQLKGDEKFHYLVDTDGFVVEEKDNGYSYLLKENNGQVKLSSALATNNSRPQNAVRHDELVIPENNKYAIPDVAEPTGGNEQTNLLTILVEFTDQKLDARYNDSFWAGLMYDEGQNSVNKYYTEVSNGKRSVVFPNETSNIQNDGVVKVSLDIPHPEPEKAPDADEKATRIMSIVHKACAAANQYVDFSQYDKDKNKYITSDEMVISFVVAGFEASTRVVDKSVWAHQWSNCLPQDIICDGVNLLRNGTLGTKPINGTYIMQGELLSFSGNKTGHLEIGTLCHELGHALGLPDLYNTLTNETDPTPGIGCLSLMASGGWGANVGEVSGTTPSYLDAWCKVELGWIDPIVLDPNSSERYLSNAFASGDYNVYKIPTSDPKEYFLVENRQFTGFDKPIEKMFPSPGIAVWHIDDDIINTYEESNQINSAGHKMGVAIEFQNYEVDKKHPFLALTGGKCMTFNETSTPNSDLNSPILVGGDTKSGVKITTSAAPSHAMAFYLNYAPQDVKISMEQTKTMATFNNNSPTAVTVYPIVATYKNKILVKTEVKDSFQVASNATSAPIQMLDGTESADCQYKFMFWDGISTMTPYVKAITK